MTLPFPNGNIGARKWQCFVCGVEHAEFESFRDHIVESHEEGREFIICPLDRCKAPVRDLKAHFKVKHPYDPMPKDVMMRATIWKDISANGKVKTRKPQFKEGHYSSTKMNKTFKYRSGYEEKVFECLDEWNDVVAFEVEPFEISYIYNGRGHKYIPDLLVKFIDGHVELWEVKPSDQTNLPRNKAKWEYAKDYCEVRGWKFETMTEVGINKLKQTVKTQNTKIN